MHTPDQYCAADFPFLPELPPGMLLRPGDRSSDVKALQRGLRAAGYALDIDGYFGRITLACVSSFLACPTQSRRDDSDEIPAYSG